MPTFAFAGDQAAVDHAGKKKPAEIMPITTANLRGHESLYREGWFIVSSTEKALAYAKAHAISSSSRAVAEMQAGLARHSDEYGKDVMEVGKKSVRTGVDVAKHGTTLTKKELALTGKLMRQEIDYGSRTMERAWERFYKGNITLAERTEADRQALAALPGNYYRDLKSDFRNLHELTDRAKGKVSTHIEGRWSEAFGEAQASFSQSYETSGTRGNSLSGLADIMAGYGKALYAGVVKPAARSTVQGTETVAKAATKVVFLPVASLFIVTGRTVASAGMSVYYTTSTGIKLISPTVEGGLLAGMSLLSYGSVPVTGVLGGTAGAINQVAVSAAAPAVAAGRAAIAGAGETAHYAAQVTYDLAKGTTRVALNQAQTGITLGYNALTAVPTQVVLGAANGVVFLSWDGPRLVLATAKGEVAWRDEQGVEERVPVASLPVGSVVDLQALGQEKGVTVEVVSDDPEVIQQVLERLPRDLRVGGQP
jgi:hypothetical protein